MYMTSLDDKILFQGKWEAILGFKITQVVIWKMETERVKLKIKRLLRKFLQHSRQANHGSG